VCFSLSNPGVVKARRRHRRIVQNLTVPVGMVRFCLYDDRAESPSTGSAQVVEIGGRAHQLLQIPPGIWYGFQALERRHALVANCTSLPYDDGEVDRLAPLDSGRPAEWNVRDPGATVNARPRPGRRLAAAVRGAPFQARPGAG